jgi:hypothetical protein
MKYILILAILLLSINLALPQAGKNFIDSVEQTITNTKEELIKIKEDYYVIHLANRQCVGGWTGCSSPTENLHISTQRHF